MPRDTPALTDDGLETTVVFDGGFDLPCFASFPLLDHECGQAALRRYFEPFLSTLSHAELDEAEELDEGNPKALGSNNAALRDMLPSVRLLGGCCGTDHRHVAEIIAAWDSP